jgi:hypothetical protein
MLISFFILFEVCFKSCWGFARLQVDKNVASMIAEDKRQKELQREAFRQQVATMLASKSYNLDDFIREMKVSLSFPVFHIISRHFQTVRFLHFVPLFRAPLKPRALKPVSLVRCA